MTGRRGVDRKADATADATPGSLAGVDPAPLEAESVNGPWARARVCVIPIVLLLCVTTPFLHRGDWRRTDTGRYAALGLHAWRSGELWTLGTGPGDPYFNKPPLVIWIHGLSLHTLGPGPWGARLPTVLCALGCLAATIAVTRRLAGPDAALWTGVVLALTHDFFRRTRSISLDEWQLMFLMLMVLAVVVGTERARRSGRGASAGGWFAAAGVPLGLALLCKPLVALVAPVILAGWLWWIGRRSLVPWLAGTIAMGVFVAAPWHLSMYLLHAGAFLDQYFGVEIADRAAGKLTSAPSDAKPVWYYGLHLASTYWPWLALVALALFRWWRVGRLSARGEAERWAAVWAGVWLVLLTVFADRRDRYALLVMPSMAVLAGLWISALSLPAWLRTRGADVMTGLAVLLAPLGVLIPVGGEDGEPAQWRALYAWIDARRAESAGRMPELWQGGFALDRRARVYLRYGLWPRITRNERGEFVVDRSAAPAAGALLLYHRRDGLAPGRNETAEFTSGDLRVTRLGEGGWQPVPTPDPGDGD